MGGCCSSGENVRDLKEGEEETVDFREGRRVRLRGSCAVASMFSKQGKKGVNQDAMTVWEDFTGEKDKIFCGIFDGHGPFGHRVARHVRNTLPAKLFSESESESESSPLSVNDNSSDNDDNGDGSDYPPFFSLWKASFVKAFKEMDRELGEHPTIDCFCSGTTAVSVVKEGEHLIIANLGDSRAVLCTRDGKDEFSVVQLTVDQKPDLPSEAERIRNCEGRVFALEDEPDVHRLWLPDEDCPGLAMARAFGDFCLKSYGLISIPQVSYRRITDKDEFVVLATDGVWDVLSNKEVVKIVASARNRSKAANELVDRAVQAWKSKYPTSKIDDCAVICLFLKFPSSVENPMLDLPEDGHKPLFSVESRDVKIKQDSGTVAGEAVDNKEWTALEGVSRVNSLVKLPRIESK